MSRLIRTLGLLMAVFVPALASAQATASITGVVKDTSGAVLPGVTVEASSPALIERSRSAVSDGTGQYRIVQLPPGVYTVTFALAGFNTIKREGIELTGSFVASVNVDMKVGAVAETVTVTGETPVVDLQSTKAERTLSNDVIAAIPTGRGFQNLVVLIPGIVSSGTQDVGGGAGDVQVDYTKNGGNAADGRLKMNGVSIAPPERAGGNTSMFVANAGAAQEVSITTSGGLGESETAGIVVNIIAKDGGNVFKGTVFGNFANSSMQGNNFTDALKAQGLKAANGVEKVWDLSPSFGGPIRQDKLWFFLTGRYFGYRNTVAGMFPNVNAGNPLSWTYSPDQSRQTITDGTWNEQSLRTTWQVTPRNKVTAYWGEEYRCVTCIGGGSATTATEATGRSRTTPNRVLQANWSSPITNRVLAEFGAGTYQARWGSQERTEVQTIGLVPVSEQCSAGCAANGGIAGLNYRNFNPARNWDLTFTTNGSLSYVTGAHNMKAGFINTQLTRTPKSWSNAGYVAYRLNNGVPNQLTESAINTATTDIHTLGIYIQDSWTLNRLTLQGGLRYDHETSSFPDQELPGSRFLPTLQFAAQDGANFHDITPRVGVAYDLFGKGKTAIKASVGKYVVAQDGGGSVFTSPLNPISRLALSTTRTWTDGNKNFAPDCDLSNPNQQDLRAAGGDFCGIFNNVNFGTSNGATRYDPGILSGWGVRPYNWEISAGVQQQILPRMSVAVTYGRRWFGNFVATDNRFTTVADYTVFNLPVPVDARLANSGGTVTLADVNPVSTTGVALAGKVDNLVTAASNYGTQLQHWNGFDLTVNTRFNNGLLLQGGMNAGRTTTDNCEIVAKIPESAGTLPLNYCDQSFFLTQARFLGSYTIPKIDVLVSGTLQALPGPQLAANWAASSTTNIQPVLGRPVTGGAPTVTVNLVRPGDLFADRITQVDFRVGKIFRFSGAKRIQVSFDLYNALNSSTVQTYNQAYIPNGAWLTPTLILPPRLAKVSAQFDF